MPRVYPEPIDHIPTGARYTAGTSEWAKSYKESNKNPLFEQPKERQIWVLALIAGIALVLVIGWMILTI